MINFHPSPCIILNSTLVLIDKCKILESSLCCAVLYVVRAIISLLITVCLASQSDIALPCRQAEFPCSISSEIFTASVSQIKDF